MSRDLAGEAQAMVDIAERHAGRNNIDRESREAFLELARGASRLAARLRVHGATPMTPLKTRYGALVPVGQEDPEPDEEYPPTVVDTTA